MTRRQSLGPLDPIYNVRIKYGAVQVGNTPTDTPFLEVAGSCSIPNARWATVATGGYCMVLTLDGNLYTVDVSDPDNPTVVTITAGIGDPLGTYYMRIGTDSYLYIGTGGVVPALSGMRIMDISNPVSPTTVGFIALSNAHSVWTDGSLALVTRHGGIGLTSVSIANPAVPTAISTLGGFGTTSAGVIKNGNVAYVTEHSSDAIAAVNVSNPAAMSIMSVVGSSPLLNGPSHPALQGIYLYVPSIFDDVIAVVNVLNPSGLFIQSSFTDPAINGAFAALISSGYLFVTANVADSLSVINIANPDSLSLVTTVTDPLLNGPEGFDIAGNYAYVACRAGNRLTLVRINPS